MLSAIDTWILSAIAALSGGALFWAFRRFTDGRRSALAKRQIRARLYAIRLYANEPALVFRAQKQLFGWNGRYLALMLRPAAVVIIPAAILFWQLDNVYGRRPLGPGEAAIVTAGFSGAVDLRAVDPVLEGRNMVVETPALRLPHLHRACWRVRAIGASSGSVILRLPGAAAVKIVEAGSGLRYLRQRSTVSRQGPVRWIEVSYPAASVRAFGYGIPWAWWFLAVTLLMSLGLARV